MITRRNLLAGSAVALAVAALSRGPRASAAGNMKFEITHTDAQWRKLLTPEQFAVLRQQATERAFTSELLHEKRKGTFICAGCELDLFLSATKFESGTGWPSFYKPMRGAVGTTSDSALMMERTEVHCRRCGGHLGHVFDDGPRPTGLRYCINGLALKFRPDAA